MKNTLVLLTSGFPFYNSEGFLNYEIFTAADYYDRILIFAVNDKFDTPLPLPHKAEAYKIFVKTSTLSKSLRAFKYMFSQHESWKLLKKHRKVNFKTKLYYIYIRSLAEQTFSNVRRSLSKINFEQDEKITIYSYWFNDLAYTAIKLKNTIFKNHEVKIVSRAHRGDLYEEQNRFGFYPLKEYNMNYVDRIYTCSEDGACYLRNVFCQDGNKIECQYLGSQDFGVQPVKGNVDFTIASCSYFVPVKRINLIIDALALCKDKNYSIRWVHFGGGPLFDSLKTCAQEKLDGRIKFHFYGQVRNDEIIDFYKNNYIDLFINVSSSEGIPVSIMEAMSFGIPVIATDVGGTKELVNNSVGYLINKDFDTVELAEKIIKFIEMPREEMDSLRRIARYQWNQKFNATKNYNAFYKNLQSLWDSNKAKIK